MKEQPMVTTTIKPSELLKLPRDVQTALLERDAVIEHQRGMIWNSVSYNKEITTLRAEIEEKDEEIARVKAAGEVQAEVRFEVERQMNANARRADAAEARVHRRDLEIERWQLASGVLSQSEKSGGDSDVTPDDLERSIAALEQELAEAKKDSARIAVWVDMKIAEYKSIPRKTSYGDGVLSAFRECKAAIDDAVGGEQE